jgi:hypothetical protein
MQSGAEHFVGLSEGDTAAKVLELTGGLGVSAALVLTAANGAYASAPGMLKFGGRLVCVGLPEGEMKPIATAFPQILVAKAQSIVGVAVGNRQEAIETLELASRGLVKTHFRVEKMDKLTDVSLVLSLFGEIEANDFCRSLRRWRKGSYRVELFWIWRRNRGLEVENGTRSIYQPRYSNGKKTHLFAFELTADLQKQNRWCPRSLQCD